MHTSRKQRGRKDVFEVWKEWGETLSVLLRRFRTEYGIDEKTKITYAGRLDPAAEGIVLLLTGKAVHKKDNYAAYDKTYTLSVLFGVQTDTGDLLGMPLRVQPKSIEFSKKTLEGFVGTLTLPYPLYSSKPVGGIPLFMYARNNTAVDIPYRNMEIKTIAYDAQETIDAKTILEKVSALTAIVQGDFRQEDIVQSWRKSLSQTDVYKIVTITVTASSGTYMRTLAEAIGEAIGVPACAYHIVRTSISM